jgi:hypothetical protein
VSSWRPQETRTEQHDLRRTRPLHLALCSEG